MEPSDAVDALFCEAFALLDGAAPASSVSSSTPPPTVVVRRRKPHGEGGAARRKRWLAELRNEATVLRGELARLRGRAPHSAVRARALDERAKRRRAERECAQLRDALYQHSQFVRGVRGFVQAVEAPTSLSLNLYHHLHNFTRLPRDASVRQLEYAVLQRDQRFGAAMALLERETAALSLVDPAQSQVDFAAAADEPCAITTKRVYVLEDTDDVDAVRRAACVAVHDLVARCRTYQWVGVAGESVDAEALEASGAQYTVTSIHRTSENDTEGFSLESRSLTMHQTTDGSVVMLWDFVDEDELHPPGAAHDVFRQGIGACLIRREGCADGVVRTVYREVSTRRYAYRGPSPPPADIVRYVASKQLGIQEYERIYHDLMLALIKREEAAMHRTVLECSV